MARLLNRPETPPPDRGCSIGGPRCIRCRIVAGCYLADESLDQAVLRNARYADVIRLIDAGHSRAEVMRRVGVSETTIRRALEAYRMGEVDMEAPTPVAPLDLQIRGPSELCQGAGPPRLLAAGSGRA